MRQRSDVRCPTAGYTTSSPPGVGCASPAAENGSPRWYRTRPFESCWPFLGQWPAYSSNAPAACTAARSNGGRPPCVVTGSRCCPTGALAVTPCERTVRWISRHSNPCTVRLFGQLRGDLGVHRDRG